MENTTQSTILAINPGTRYIGIAVLVGTDLVDWGVKVMEGKWSPEKLVKAMHVISALIADYQPNTIAIKRPHPSRTSAQLDELCREIIEMAEKHGIEIQDYSIEEIETFHGQGTRINKARLAKLVCVKYPALARALRREQRSSNPYHVRMFEAVALACACNACNDRCLSRGKMSP